MIDLSRPTRKKQEEPEELPVIVEGLIFVIFSAFIALIVLSGIAGEPLI